MLSKPKSKFKLAIFISILLHVILIGVLIIGAMTRINQLAGGEGGGEKIDAIMVDPNAMAQQFDRQQQQRLESARAENLRREQAAKQADELQKQQQEELQRLKQLERERLEAQETARQAAEQKQQQEEAARQAKAEAERQQLLALEARRKTEQEARERAAQELAEKQRLEKELKEAAERKRQAEAEAARAKAEADKQRQIAEETKRRADEAKRQEAELRDLFGGLASPTNAPSASSASGGGNRSGASAADINNYAGQILNAIQNKFKDPQLYRGKTCTLRIKLAPDGLLLDVKAEDGDPALCREAMSATRMATIPKPPNKSVYEAFKNEPILFKPE